MYQPVRRTNGAGVARVQRQAQILTCLYDQRYPESGALQCNDGARRGWMSTGQIARCCNMAASPHFRLMLIELCDKGHVVGEAEEYRPNMQIYFWSLSPSARYSEEWHGVFDAYLGESLVHRPSGGQ